LTNELLIPIPTKQAELSKVIAKEIEKARKARSEEIEAINHIRNSPAEFIE